MADKLTDMIDRERAKNEQGSGFFKKLFSIIAIILVIGYAGNWSYQQYIAFTKNLDSLNTTKYAVFGNDNNNKGVSSMAFKASLGSKTVSFSNFEEFKRELDKVYEDFSNKTYTFVGKENDRLVFEEKIKFSQLGYFLNVPQVAQYVKDRIDSEEAKSSSGIIVDLANFSYIDNKKIVDTKDVLVKNQVKSGGDLNFSSQSGFSISDENYSFYVMNVDREDIKKINLADPSDTVGTIYFSMKKTDVNEKLTKLNEIYSSMKKLNVSVFVPSKQNRKNLEGFKEKFPQYRMSVSNEGLNIFVEGNKIVEGLVYENGVLSYRDVNFFNSGTVYVSASETNIIVKTIGFFDLMNPNLEENYPTSDDFTRIINDNGLTIDFGKTNSKVNEYLKFQLASGATDKNGVHTVLAETMPDKGQSPIVTIDKIFGKTGYIKHPSAKTALITKKQLYSSQTPIVIKDTENTVASMSVKKLTIDGKEYGVGSAFQVLGDACKIKDIFKAGFSMECAYADSYNVLNGAGMVKNIKNKVLFFENISTDASLFFYEQEMPVKVEFSNVERTKGNLYAKLSEYVNLDIGMIDEIKYVKGSFEIHFKPDFNWYVKSSEDSDTFLFFILTLK